MDFCDPESHLRKVKYRIWNPHKISKKKKFVFKNLKNILHASVHLAINKIYIRMSKSNIKAKLNFKMFKKDFI